MMKTMQTRLVCFVMGMMTAKVAAQVYKCNATSVAGVKGFVFDLDGTLYSDVGLNSGADDLTSYLGTRTIPYTFASNSIKSADAVKEMLSTIPAFKLTTAPPVTNIFTSTSSLAKFFNQKAGTKNSFFFVVGTDDNRKKENMATILKKAKTSASDIVWEFRTDMTLQQIHTKIADKSVDKYVILALDGDANNDVVKDPSTNKSGYQTLDYELMIKVHRLIRNGAHFVVANPAHNNPPLKSSQYLEIGTGSFEEYFTMSAQMFEGTPFRTSHFHSPGIGGNKKRTQLHAAVDKLTGVPKEGIVYVADDLETELTPADAEEVLAIRRVLVTTGVSKMGDVKEGSKLTCYVDNLEQLHQALKDVRTSDVKTSTMPTTSAAGSISTLSVIPMGIISLAASLLFQAFGK